MTGSPGQASRIDGLFELAFRRHQAGQLREAEELYRNILEADPRQLDCLYFLGMIALQDGRPENAVDLIGQAIAANDKIAAHHAGIAEAYGRLGERDNAISHYRKAVAIEPGHWAAQHQLAALLFDQGDANAALEASSRALAVKDAPEVRALFVQCVRNADRLPPVLEFRALMIRALREGWARPGELTSAAIAVIKAEPTVARGINAAMASWPRRLSPMEMAQPIGVLVQDNLARAVLDTAPVNDIGLERLLTSVRTILLDAATQAKSEISREMISLCVFARAPVLHQRICVRRLRHGAPGTGVAAHVGALCARRPRAGVRDPPPCAGVLRAAAHARPRSGHSLAQLAQAARRADHRTGARAADRGRAARRDAAPDRDR